MASSPIDWGNVFGNMLWILGCAVALATLSYQSWLASKHRAKYSTMLKQPGAQFAMDLAGLLFCLGLAVTANSWVKYLIWGLFSAAFLYLAILAYQAMRREQQAKKD
jgi:Ca2+/Na+ antiporter